MKAGTAEWFAARIGKVTGTGISSLMARLSKGNRPAEFFDYLEEKIYERLTNTAYDNFVTYDMQRGIDLEADARFIYEVAAEHNIIEVGFMDHETIDNYGGSPDGLIALADGKNAVIEIKVPKPKTHMRLLVRGVEDKLHPLRSQDKPTRVPNDYFFQCCSNAFVTDSSWCDFISYCPELPEPLNKYIERVYLTDQIAEAMSREVIEFNQMVDDGIKKLQGN